MRELCLTWDNRIGSHVLENYPHQFSLKSENLEQNVVLQLNLLMISVTSD